MDFEDNNPLGVSDEETPRPRIRPANSANSNAGRRIVISDASKAREGSNRGHISYTIRLYSGTTVKRRYSDFESLRKLLRRLFPCVVVPPIPEKHPLSAYAANPAHAHEDSSVIEHRMRTLADFLNRCVAVPDIHDSWALERFLDPNTAWREVLLSERVAKLPRSPLQAPPVDPAQATPAHAYLPIPSSSAKIASSKGSAAKNSANTTAGGASGSGSDDESDLGESTAKEYEAAIGSGLEKRARKVNRHYETLAHEYGDLGGQFNSFSLDSQGNFEKFAPAVEKVGQAVDQGFLSTGRLVEQLGVEFSEPLAESVQLAVTARQVLKYRRQREMQVHILSDALERQEAQLSALVDAETEAERMNAYLHADDRIAQATQGLGTYGDQRESAGSEVAGTERATSNGSEYERATSVGAASIGSAGSDRDHVVDRLGEHDHDHEISGMRIDLDSDSETESLVPTVDETAPPSNVKNTAGTSKSRKYAAPSLRMGFKLPGLSHINNAIHGMMDVDPQTTRRNNISRTRERIQQLRAALEVAKVDSEAAGTAVTAEIARYNTAKHEDIKDLVRAFVRCHIEWAEKNLESWTEAKQAIIDS